MGGGVGRSRAVLAVLSWFWLGAMTTGRRCLFEHAARLYNWGAAAPQNPRSLLRGPRPPDPPVGALPAPSPQMRGVWGTAAPQPGV